MRTSSTGKIQWVISGVALISALLLTPPAVAQTAQQIGWCTDSGTPEQKIEGCSAMIRSRQYRDEKLAAIFNQRAIAYAMKRQYDLAIADYNQSILHDFSNFDTFYNRGLSYRRKGDFDHAIADFTRAITGFNPSRHPLSYKRDYFKARGDANRDKNDLDNAIADYGEAIKLDPKFARAIYNRGETKRKMGDIAGADADIAQAKQLQEDIEPEI